MGGVEPILGLIESDTEIAFSDELFNKATLANVQAEFLTWSDALTSHESATPLTIDELRTVIESGADVSANLIIGGDERDIDIPLHLDRMEYADLGAIVLNGTIIDTFLSSSSLDGTGYAIYAEVRYDTAWSGKVVWRTDVIGK